MAADFPASIPVIVRVLPTDMMDGAGTEADVLHNDLADEVEALATVIGVTGSIVPTTVEARITALQGSSTPETASTIGTLIAGSSDKATPVDADNIAISDSAAANILKRLSWANVKTALASVFARLAGTAGGQTLIGGTAASENLTLLSTSNATKGAIIFGTASKYDHANDRLGLGTLTPTAKVHALATTEQIRLGYDNNNYLSCAVDSAGSVTLAATGGKYDFLSSGSSAALGSELLANNAFTSDLSGWADSGASWSWVSGSASHAAGSASTLSQSIAVSNGLTYQIDFTISNRTAGSISIALGAVSVIESGSSTAFTGSSARTVIGGATGSVALTITPTSDFDGRIDLISVKSVAIGSAAIALAVTQSGNAAVELRCSYSLSNLAIGKGAGGSITTGVNNSICGFEAGSFITTGHANTVLGYRSSYSLRTGFANCSVGWGSGYSLSSGYYNTNVGYSSGYSITFGSSNSNYGYNSGRSITTAISNANYGSNAGYNITTGSTNSCFGASSGRYLADGTTGLITPTNCVYVGALTKGSADGVTAENVFGFGAIGVGSNTTCIGASTNTKTQIYGDIVLDKTVTAAGTTGAQTINKTCGSVNFAAGATSLVVTDSRVTTASVIVATVATNDATMKTVLVVAAAGSFTIIANAAATAETRVNFIVIN